MKSATSVWSLRKQTSKISFLETSTSMLPPDNDKIDKHYLFLLVHEVIYVASRIVNLNNDLKQYHTDDFFHELISRTT